MFAGSLGEQIIYERMIILNKKRLFAAVSAVACFVSTFAVFPDKAGMQTYASEAVNNNFETDYEGWHSNSDITELTAVSGIGVGGSRGMAVTNRRTSSDGAASSKGFYLWGGVKYNYSVKVKADTDETFRLSLRYIDEETEKETIVALDSVKAKAGEWAQLSDSFKAPEGSYEYELTITTDSTNDFVFDDVVITTKENISAKAAPAGKGLKDEFANYGFRVGNILNGGTVKNSAITAIMLKDHNAIECENETKPDATLVQNGTTNTDVKVSLNSCAAIADFCVKNDIAFRGHTLVWHSQTPEWFFKSNFQQSGSWVDKNTMNQRMESYIKNMFNAFATQYPSLNLYAYDVANECVSDDSNRTANAGGSREPGYGNGKSPWVQVYGDNSFVEQAFTYARKYAPAGCDLYYNDYNEYWDHKRDAIYNMCKNLYNKGILDGVGMQSHVPANATGFAGTDSYIQAMHKYLSIGCDVQVTELDISLESGKYSLQDQANKYKAIFQEAMDINTSGKYNGKVTLVQVWGPNDGNSWLSAGSNALLYDANNQPKPAYTTLTSMIPDSEWGDGSSFNGGTTGGGDVEPNEYGWYYHHSYEDGTDGWGDRGGNSVTTSSSEHYTEYGSKSLFVSDRTSEWMGAIYTLSPRAFKAGETYSFSAHVKQKSGENVKFMMKIEYTDGSGETAYDEVASAVAPDGKWTQLVNTKYTIPADASDVKIYIETEESLCDFYVDEAIGAVGGTGISGEGQPDVPRDPGTIIRGDTDLDGRITATDMVNARKAYLGTITDADVLKAADVDQSGKVEMNDLVLLSEYLLGQIKEFPSNRPPVDTAAMEALFKGVTLAESWKKDGENNPLTTQRFGADPGFMVYKDRLYVYTTNDAFEYNNNGQIKENTYDVGTINCVSSSDLVNWTDHGAIPVADRNGRTTNGAAKWASASWAPDACWKTINGKDKFFLYFANSAGGIGVLTADSPEGPWTDPIGGPLITKQTPNCGDVEWMFDPAVFVDDDGTGYIYFGGGVPSGKASDPGTGRCAKLGADMVSLDGAPVKMQIPYLFEDSSVLKIGNKYYYSYCTNWNVPGGTSVNGVSFNNADICYMVSDNPLGPWTSSNLKGNVFKNTASQRIDNGGNNHHSIVYFKNEYYVLYHSRQQAIRMEVNALTSDGKINVDGNYRSTQLNKATYNASTGELSCSGDMKGVSQLETLNPYTTVQAETMSNQSKGISISGLGDTKVAGKKGEWIKVSGVKFDKGASSFTVKGSAKSGGAVRVSVGSPTGDVIAYAELGSSLDSVTVPTVSDISGTKDIYITFSSNDMELDSWSFQ